MPQKYKTNRLKQVILRLDFEKVELGKLSEFYNGDLKSKFPFFSEKTLYQGGFEVNFKNNEVTSKQQEQGKIYIFENKKKDKKLEIGPNYLFIQYLAYSNSEELLKDTKEIVKPLIETFKVQTINRIGLRYENVISLKEKNPLDWGKYFDKQLLGHLTFGAKSKRKIARSMGQIILKEAFGDMTFNFGIWNPEFPNEINVKEFILDYDCYSRLPFIPSEDDLHETVKAFQSFIEESFESSITKEFRNLLNK